VEAPAVEATLERGLRLDARGLEGPPPADGRRVFTSVYYDTPGRRLALAGLDLCRRTEHGKSVWRLGLPRPEGRLVLEAPGGPAGPPGPLAELLGALLHGGARLAPVLELRTRRAGSWVERRDGAEAEVALEDVDVLDHGRSAGSLRELGVVLVSGDLPALRAVERALRKRGASDPERLLGAGAEADADRSAVGLLRAALRRQYARLLAHDPGVRLGDEPEDVHDVRVAVRRLRAMLRTARPFVDEAWAGPLRSELRWLGNAFGELRDLDVLCDFLAADARALDEEARDATGFVLEALEPERAAARRRALEALGSPRYLALLEELERAADGPRIRQSEVDVVALAAREFGRLRKEVRRSAGGSDAELHALRIHAKRARYAVELAGPLLGRRGERFLDAARRFQDVVGEHQDAVVAAARLRALLPAAPDPPRAFALGRLVERQHARRTRARADLPRAWRRLERRGRRLFG
jgi:CHAD domain-containing protein